MNRNLLALLFTSYLCAAAVGDAVAEPFIPRDDRQVLERLRLNALDPVAREMRALRKKLQADPRDLGLAATLARRCLEQYRAEADPRYLGHAQSALSPWWKESQPPVEALVLRATLKQSEHDFNGALADLELASRVQPENTQVWVTKATILTVLGRYEEAQKACVPLARLAPGIISVTAAGVVGSMTGNAERSSELLKRALENDSSASASEQVWTLTILAEISARLGKPAEAEEFYKRAMRMEERDIYLLSSYADFLLDQKRSREAVELLKGETRVDGLLLRLCLAESQLEPKSKAFAEHLDLLKARFKASRLRGDNLHRREEARSQLKLFGQPAEALRLAEENWKVQREPADARVLLEAALASENQETVRTVVSFVQSNRLQDVELARLLGGIK
jgi:tetratricopeptide (TPR) repeat protein